MPDAVSGRKSWIAWKYEKAKTNLLPGYICQNQIEIWEKSIKNVVTGLANILSDRSYFLWTIWDCDSNLTFPRNLENIQQQQHFFPTDSLVFCNVNFSLICNFLLGVWFSKLWIVFLTRPALNWSFPLAPQTFCLFSTVRDSLWLEINIGVSKTFSQWLPRTRVP